MFLSDSSSVPPIIYSDGNDVRIQHYELGSGDKHSLIVPNDAT